MSPIRTVLFDCDETLGVVLCDASGRSARLSAHSYIPEVLDSLRRKNLSLGILSVPRGAAPITAKALEHSNIIQYFSPELLTFAGPEESQYAPTDNLFELALEVFGGRGLKAENCLFVGESRVSRTLAGLAGIKAVPHPLLAEAAGEGQTTVYVKLTTGAEGEKLALGAFDGSPVVPFYRSSSDGVTEIIALSTDDMIPHLEAGGFDVKSLSAKVDALHDDLYLLVDAAGLDQDAEFVSDLERQDIKPVLTVKGGLVVALPPHQNIDAFHFGRGHGHNLKLFAETHSAAPIADFSEQEHTDELSTSEMQLIASSITEARMEEALKFVTGTSPRSPEPSDEFLTPQNVGSNRHVLSPQMSAFTDALAAKLDHIGRGAFDISRHRFEITGNCVRDVNGVPVALRVELDNVIAELPGESGDCILVTAHLDSTAVESHGKDKYDPEIHDAPGMDDDGSGVAGVLVIAEAMCERFASRKPPLTLRFVLFNAEEQGLIGSQRYARSLVENGTRIVGVFQLDMISYNRVEPNSFETHAGTADRDRWPHYSREVELASLKLSNRIRRVSEMLKEHDLSYLEPAQVYKSPDGAAGRSDHASFHRCGYAACLTCEDFFPCPGVSEPNPHYHRETDRLANLPYLTAITRVVFGAVLGVCDPSDP